MYEARVYSLVCMELFDLCREKEIECDALARPLQVEIVTEALKSMDFGWMYEDLISKVPKYIRKHGV